MKTIQAFVRGGRVVSQPLEASDNTRCLVTILEEDLDGLRDIAGSRLTAAKQKRLSRLLADNKRRRLTKSEERELDQILAEVHGLMAARAEASWVLGELKNGDA